MRRSPAGVRLDPGPGLPHWGDEDFDELLEETERFHRVGAAALEPAALLRAVVAGLFGARSDAGGGRYELSPWLPRGWKALALRRLRCHRTLLDVEVRPRAEWVTLRLELGFGPAIPLALSVRNAGAIARVMVDETPLEGARPVFTLQARHEAVFFFASPAPDHASSGG